MKTIVITGASRGIGYGLAEEFLKSGHRVTICGRSPESINAAVTTLSAKYGNQRLLGQVCDVADYNQVQKLWDETVARFGGVDIWINNAGISNLRQSFWKLPVESINNIVQTNLLGMMYGSKIAMLAMLQQGYGQIYNMEGLGSTGSVTPGLLLYGTTKSALTYYTKGLIKEAKDTPVQVNLLSPGMVATDMLTDTLHGIDDVERTKRVFNILADRVETVAPYLVKRILANRQHGKRIAWLTSQKAAWRFLSSRFNLSKRELIYT
jgi:short-subunit dehydrogenase